MTPKHKTFTNKDVQYQVSINNLIEANSKHFKNLFTFQAAFVQFSEVFSRSLNFKFHKNQMFFSFCLYKVLYMMECLTSIHTYIYICTSIYLQFQISDDDLCKISNPFSIHRTEDSNFSLGQLTNINVTNPNFLDASNVLMNYFKPFQSIIFIRIITRFNI